MSKKGEILHTIGDIGQWLALLFTIIGISHMLIFRVDIASILITAGAIILTIATKAKYYGKKLKDEEDAAKRRKQIKLYRRSVNDK